MPALIFGVAVGNLLQGVPFDFTNDLRSVYEGVWFMKFLGLLNPFALLVGVMSLSMLLLHGAARLSVKAEGKVTAEGTVKDRARAIRSLAALVALGGYVLAGLGLG